MISGIWFIIAFVVIAVLVIIKIANEKQAIAIKVLVILFIFFVITAGYVAMKKNVDLKTFDGVVYAGKVYFAWMGGFIKNIGKVTGYAINQDWGLNITNSTQTDDFP